MSPSRATDGKVDMHIQPFRNVLCIHLMKCTMNAALSFLSNRGLADKE